MGKRKREIMLVQDKQNRMVTFSKRRQGLFKKAKKLSILCGCEIAIVTFSGAGKAFTFGSPDPDTVIRRYHTNTSIPFSIKDHPKDQMVMFSKRRQSLFKKAKELSILCGCEIAIVTIDGAANVFTFGLPDPDTVIRRYIGHTSIPSSPIKKRQRQPKHLLDVMDSAEQQSEEDLASPKRVVLEHVSDRVLVCLKEISCLSPSRFGFVFSSSACYSSAASATSTTFIWIRYQYGLPSSMYDDRCGVYRQLDGKRASISTLVPPVQKEGFGFRSPISSAEEGLTFSLDAFGFQSYYQLMLSRLRMMGFEYH
ncbi:hypothetical protein AAC387_Pa01g1880 [Persea americana]